MILISLLAPVVWNTLLIELGSIQINRNQTMEILATRATDGIMENHIKVNIEKTLAVDFLNRILGAENLFNDFVSKASSYVKDNIPDMSHVTDTINRHMTSTMEKVKMGSKSSFKSLFKIAKSKTIQFFGAVESLLDDNPEDNSSQ